MQRESMEFDVVIIGAGPAGLACAIQLMQCNRHLSVCVLEKSATVGGHIISGAILEPTALDTLLPHWRERFAEKTPVTQEAFYLLSEKKHTRLPVFNALKNKGNFIISLGKLCQWMADEAQQLGIHVFPGFAATTVLYDEAGNVIGVQTDDKGVDKSGNPGPQYQPSIDILAKQTLFAEGCRGFLSEQIIKKFELRKECDPQSYGIGLKEIWHVPETQLQPGLCLHSVGWPLDNRTYGGSFVYHTEQHIQLGFVVGLDYENPYLDPFKELQRFKHHPLILPMLENGTCIAYGARALSEGGIQSLPKLAFPGGLLMGDSAGFLNVAKIKGIHNAMHSGMIAAKSIHDKLDTEKTQHRYEKAIKDSTLYQELKQVRNIRPAFHRGLWFGLCYSGFDQLLLKGKAPWTWHFKADYTALKPAKACQPISYPKPDRNISFDRLTLLALSGVSHNENQPCHLKLKDPQQMIDINWKRFAGPEQRYCPANVYEYITEGDKTTLQINFSNCLHCKTCDIKDPTQNITWTCSEGGDGPNYSNL